MKTMNTTAYMPPVRTASSPAERVGSVSPPEGGVCVGQYLYFSHRIDRTFPGPIPEVWGVYLNKNNQSRAITINGVALPSLKFIRRSYVKFLLALNVIAFLPLILICSPV